MEEKATSIRGIYRDILIDRDESVIFDSGWESNRIVDRCRVLLAAFMKKRGDSGHTESKSRNGFGGVGSVK